MENKINLLLRKVNSHMKVHYLRSGQMEKDYLLLGNFLSFPGKEFTLNSF